MTDKILFVDDEINILGSISRQLRKRFIVKTASSGQDALQILKDEGPFAVIVSDMRMPGMDGAELLSTVKNLYPAGTFSPALAVHIANILYYQFHQDEKVGPVPEFNEEYIKNINIGDKLQKWHDLCFAYMEKSKG